MSADHDPNKQPVPVPPAAADGQLVMDDASSQALADALSSSFKIIKSLMVLIVLVFLASGIFTVKPNERAVVLRFGKPWGMSSDQLLKPGLHWAFPYPIDEIVRIPVGQTHTLVADSGWYVLPIGVTENEDPTPYAKPSLTPGVDGYNITGDGNVIHTRAVIKYRVQDSGALDYVFNFDNTTNMLASVLDNAIVYVSSQFAADDTIFGKFDQYNEAVSARFKEAVQTMRLGISIDSISLQTSAPLDVRPAFTKLIDSSQRAKTKVAEAEGIARNITNSALAQASVLVSEALTRSNLLVKSVKEEARVFTQQLPYYQSNPQLFKQRLLMETMQVALTNAQDKFFIPQRADGKTRELRLQLNRGPLEAIKPNTNR